jgi:hypothetical protein
MARKKAPAVPAEDARTIGGLLRLLRRSAGFRAVADAAGVKGCPAAKQTIYAYERGGLTPNLGQFLELVEFYASAKRPTGAKAAAVGARSDEDLRAQAVAAIARALSLRTYNVKAAHDLMERLQPPLPRRSGDDEG